MCAIGGIVDLISPLAIEPEVKSAMLETMIRRGPDQEGLFEDSHCFLLHRRLVVIDESGGRQPMTFDYKGETYTIVYNGELYNTNELRCELKSLGFDFEGHSDTEVVLKSYLAWGDQAVQRFNGIFALAVWHHKGCELYLARDPMGVKPLFYGERDGKLVFASEIKTILASGLIPPEADLTTLAEVLIMGPGRTPGCGVFRGVKEVKPGFHGYYRRTGLELSSYFCLRDEKNDDSWEEAVEKTKKLVVTAIERQLVSDVPLGTFLSGGLDSSIISAVASNYFRERGKTLDTFSVFYRDNDKYFKAGKFQPNSDSEYIDDMVNFLGCRNHKVEIDTPQLVEALYRSVEARDLPGMADVDSSLLLFCREIKKICTVALSGECADEIFGGYPWFRDKTIRESAGFPWAQSTAWRSSLLREDLALALEPESYVAAAYEKTVKEGDFSHTPLSDKENYSAKRMMRLNMVWFMQTLLDRKDRMSMYSGLEVRVPFCDKEIAQYLYTVPWRYKDHDGYEKGLLRNAVKDLLPSKILWRKKSPYPKTHNPSYLRAVSAELAELTAQGTAPLLTLVPKEKLAKLTEATLTTPWYGQLMTVPQTIAYFLQINHWLTTYKVRIV